MGALEIVLLDKGIELALLGRERRLHRLDRRFLERPVHPFMASVLSGLARTDALGADAELNPPLGELAEAAQGQGGKWRPVIGADGLGPPCSRNTHSNHGRTAASVGCSNPRHCSR